MVGPLLHTLGTARIPNLGGCKIGDRPIDYHMAALRKFGAVVEKDDETGTTLIVPEEGLKGAEIVLNYPSVGATEQVLLTGVRAKGKTVLRNAAIEPEIIDLIAVLQKMGAIIFINEDRTIVIEGVDELTGYDHTSLPDRNESASWASAALATGGDIFVRGADQKDMTAFLNQFRKMGGLYEVTAEGIRFTHPAQRTPGAQLKPIVFETNVHPGFMTDWQQPLVVALTQAKGASIVHETVYEERFGFTNALKQMGADIVVMEVPDLRGGFSHIIAALAAKGTSHVSGVELIARGYENFEEKLKGLGANFEVLTRKVSKAPKPDAAIVVVEPEEVEVQD